MSTGGIDKQNSAEKAVQEREISRYDRKVLEMFADGFSVEEIALKVPGDETPAMIGFRIKRLLASRSGLLNAAEDAALHMFDLQRLKKKAWSMLDLEDGNRALTGIAAVMQQIGLRIDQAAARSDEMLGQIRRAQAREFAAALEMAYDGVVSRLHQRYPDVDKTVLRDVFSEEFGRAVTRIDRLVEDDE
jgi:hypothetical protein